MLMFSTFYDTASVGDMQALLGEAGIDAAADADIDAYCARSASAYINLEDVIGGGDVVAAVLDESVPLPVLKATPVSEPAPALAPPVFTVAPSAFSMAPTPFSAAPRVWAPPAQTLALPKALHQSARALAPAPPARPAPTTREEARSRNSTYARKKRAHERLDDKRCAALGGLLIDLVAKHHGVDVPPAVREDLESPTYSVRADARKRLCVAIDAAGVFAHPANLDAEDLAREAALGIFGA